VKSSGARPQRLRQRLQLAVIYQTADVAIAKA
jgi:hypothetical protein